MIFQIHLLLQLIVFYQLSEMYQISQKFDVSDLYMLQNTFQRLQSSLFLPFLNLLGHFNTAANFNFLHCSPFAFFELVDA